MALIAKLRRAEPHLPFVLLLAFALAGFSFWLQGDVGLVGFQDEGFLWYGVVHTAHGEVPMRDFRAYDPGRYYWCAAWAQLFGDGLLATRASAAIFQGFGLAFGLLAATRVLARRWMLVPVGLVLLVWMFPPWKLFEPAIAMAAVYFATALIEKPNGIRHLLAGACVGFAAFMGRNHGLYMAVAFAAAILYAWWKTRARPLFPSFAAWIAGVVVGFAPMLAMFALLPGYFDAFVESVLFYARQGDWNLARPAPFPWRLHYEKLGAFKRVEVFTTGLFFLLPFVAYPIGAVLAARVRPAAVKERALLAASVCVGLPYLHHAWNRTDVFHLAQCIHPLLLCCVALPAVVASAAWRTRATVVVIAMLTVTSAVAMGPKSSIFAKLTGEGPVNEHVEARIGGDVLWLDKNRATLLSTLESTIRSRVPSDEDLWIGPQHLVLYPMLGRTSPVWDIYPVWPADEDTQSRFIEALSGVEWALFTDSPIGGIENLRFSQSHPRVARMITREFQPVPTPGLPASYRLMQRVRR